MPHALLGLAGLGAYTYLEFTAKPKKIQEKSPLDPEKFIDFKLNPTITALSPLAAAFPFAGAHGVKPETTTTLSEEGFLDVLSVDFARALKDMTAVMKDLKALAGLGDLSAAPAAEAERTVRRLAAWAVMLAVLTAFTALFSMMFPGIPGIGSRFGYPAFLVAIGGFCAAIFYRFRRARWV